MTLTSNRVWELADPTTISEGETLTIEPCTRIEGTRTSSFLIVGRGGHLRAEGRRDAPILFTSGSASDPLPGDWGGIIIVGQAPSSLGNPSSLPLVPEEDSYEHGGNQLDDSSGILRFVRIEYAGVELTGAEYGGLNLWSVGANTEIDHVMVSQSSSDCFRMVGGRVDADHLVAGGCADDMFDVDGGYQGTLSTLFARTLSSWSDDARGWEVDGKDELEPLTRLTSERATLCGSGTDEPAPSVVGALFRENAQGQMTDQVVLGFESETELGAASWAGPTETSFDLSHCLAPGWPGPAVVNSGEGAFATESTWLEGKWVEFAD